VNDRRISIIVPCLDEGQILGAALERLQPLREQGHELIVVDGSSRDGSADLAVGLADRVEWTTAGRARQMNAGACLAGGAVLWFLHLDTEICPGAAQLLLTALAGKPGWGRFDIRLSGGHPLLRWVERAMNLRSWVSGIATGDQGIFVTRGLFEAVGGFADIPLMEDVELCHRLKRHARPHCLRTPLTTSSRRWERDGVLRTIVRMWGLRLAFALGADPRWLAQHYRPCNSPTHES
jgi:rSAM/selenodomain-associated transferase 2